ncbi:Transmembrane_domain-containing protein [Hexamita inflata]|uniref:Transmembrane domain-containing protein n=1 Tax=Hexamita inflata TaxID=28002 RepID=A0AA86RAD6_9EUKA|nr:Transmembrane domain-containing protein [Hexamita inflata]
MTNNEQQPQGDEHQEEEFQFTGCLSCLNDGVSQGMLFVSYLVCACGIGAGIFVSWLLPLYGIPFLILSSAFCILWIIFMHMYKEINPQSPYKKALDAQKVESTEGDTKKEQ